MWNRIYLIEEAAIETRKGAGNGQLCYAFTLHLEETPQADAGLLSELEADQPEPRGQGVRIGS